MARCSACRNGPNPQGSCPLRPLMREPSGEGEPADHPNLPARPRDRHCRFGSGSAGLGRSYPRVMPLRSFTPAHMSWALRVLTPLSSPSIRTARSPAEAELTTPPTAQCPRRVPMHRETMVSTAAATAAGPICVHLWLQYPSPREAWSWRKVPPPQPPGLPRQSKRNHRCTPMHTDGSRRPDRPSRTPCKCGRPPGFKSKCEKSDARVECDHGSGLLARHHGRCPSWVPRSRPEHRGGFESRCNGRVPWIVGSTDCHRVQLFHPGTGAWLGGKRPQPQCPRARPGGPSVPGSAPRHCSWTSVSGGHPRRDFGLGPGARRLRVPPVVHRPGGVAGSQFPG